MIKDEFIKAIHNANLVEVTFDSKSKGMMTRTCAPMDYGPSRRSSSDEPKYHFYNTDSSHPMPLSEEQITTMNVLEEKFNPENIVHWEPNWFIERDWGKSS